MAIQIRSARDADTEALPRDVRSWEVRTRLDDTRVGTIEDVLLDEGGATRYLEVRLETDGRHVLLPSGHATVDRDDEVVWVPGLARDAFEGVPTYPGELEALNPEYERELGIAYDQAYAPETFYESPHYATGWSRPDAGRETRRDEATVTRVDTMKDVDVADHADDPRGWTVVGRDGERLGTVEHLMGDTASMKVRYLTMRLDRDVVDEDRRVLIPAGHAALEPEHERVRVDALNRERLTGVPAWSGGPLDREHERAVTEYLAAGYVGERRYRHPRFRQDRLYPGSTRAAL